MVNRGRESLVERLALDHGLQVGHVRVTRVPRRHESRVGMLVHSNTMGSTHERSTAEPTRHVFERVSQEQSTADDFPGQWREVAGYHHVV